MSTPLTDAEILELNALCDQLVEGRLSAEDHTRLEAWLERSEVAREHYVRLMQLSASLHDYASEFQGSEDEGAAPALVRVSWPRSAAFALAACLAALLAVSGILLTRGFDQGGAVAQEDPLDEGVAVLAQSSEATWASDGPSYQPGDRLPVGTLSLESGSVGIEFYSGASLILNGPAELEIRSDMEAHCVRGTLRGNVPPQASGFTITTPDYDLVDLGTEFGLAVDSSGRSEVHVFDGEVELIHLTGEAGPRSVVGGEALRLEGATIQAEATPSPVRFPIADQLSDQAVEENRRRFRAWQQHAEGMRAREDLVAYYAFDTDQPRGRRLPNEGRSDEAGLNGAIVGAQWSAGRWPQKPALDFKSPADRVRLHLEQSFESVSLAAWVRIDGLDRRWNSLLLPETWDQGQPHWQFSREGELILGLGLEDNGTNYFSDPVLGYEHLGRWIFLAVVYDHQNAVVRHFLDDRLVSEEPILEPNLYQPIRFGMMDLGNYTPERGRENPSNIRNFNGRIDEVMLFGRALSVEEMGELYHASAGRQAP